MTPGVLQPYLSVVIPVCDERDNIGPLIDEVLALLPTGRGCEVIVVDDGSRDGSGELLAGLLETRPCLRVLQHQSRAGQSAALVGGIRAARAEWVVTLDGDGQNDPIDIPRLVAWLEDPARPAAVRLVCGHRIARRDTVLKRWSSRVAGLARRAVLGDDTPDAGCGLKLIHRSTFLALPIFDHVHRFLPALVQMHGHGVLSLPVQHRSRRSGRSKYGVLDRLWVGIVDLAGVAWLSRRRLRGEPKELLAHWQPASASMSRTSTRGA